MARQGHRTEPVTEWGSKARKREARRLRRRIDRDAVDEDGGSLITGKRAPGKKDPSLCKAAHWKRPHQPEIKIRLVYGRQPTCRWDSWAPKDQPFWFCFHQESCSGCGKTLRWQLPAEECPDFGLSAGPLGLGPLAGH